jgi:hypothetical protein
MVLTYADKIFPLGSEMQNAIHNRPKKTYRYMETALPYSFYQTIAGEQK